MEEGEYNRFLGTIQAESAQEALRLASQYWEVASYKLLVEIGS